MVPKARNRGVVCGLALPPFLLAPRTSQTYLVAGYQNTNLEALFWRQLEVAVIGRQSAPRSTVVTAAQ